MYVCICVIGERELTNNFQFQFKTLRIYAKMVAGDGDKGKKLKQSEKSETQSIDK